MKVVQLEVTILVIDNTSTGVIVPLLSKSNFLFELFTGGITVLKVLRIGINANRSEGERILLRSKLINLIFKSI